MTASGLRGSSVVQAVLLSGKRGCRVAVLPQLPKDTTVSLSYESSKSRQLFSHMYNLTKNADLQRKANGFTCLGL